MCNFEGVYLIICVCEKEYAHSCAVCYFYSACMLGMLGPFIYSFVCGSGSALKEHRPSSKFFVKNR